ncbi:TRAFAC clade GTPase domain-containing protein [Lottiidibacillus patelloidae]
MKVPSYLCKNCGKVHSDISPHFTHILFKKCNCGTRIAVSLFSKRVRNKAICNQCHVPLEFKENRVICIPVIGGPSVGKTSYVISTINKFLNESVMNNLRVKMASQHGQHELLRLTKGMKKGIFPPKTATAMPLDYNMLVKKGSSSINVERMVCLYDFAGEIYESSNRMAQYRVFNYFHGLTVIIDPFSISKVRERYETQKGFDKYRASESCLSDTLDILVLYLEKHYGIKAKEKVSQPVSFIFTKVDAYDLSEQIGVNAVQKYMDENKRKLFKLNERKVSNMMCEKFLKENGEANFLNRLEHKFSNYQFFARSSLFNENSLNSNDVSFNWMLKQIDKRVI